MSDPVPPMTAIPGLIVLDQGVTCDDIGWSKEGWHREKMAAFGLPEFNPGQLNLSHVSAQGTTWGFRAEPWDQVFNLVSGKAFGAWLDLREGPTFGHTHWLELSPDIVVFVPRGVAVAHQTLMDDTTFTCLMESRWTPETQERVGRVAAFDPVLGIPWPIGRDHAKVPRPDTLNPSLALAKPVGAMRILIAGSDTPLGRALVKELPDAVGVTVSDLRLGGVAPVDLASFDVLVHAHDSLVPESPTTSAQDSWAGAAERAHLLTDAAREHGLRYVHITSDPVFAQSGLDHDEPAVLDLADPRGQVQAAGELLAATVPRSVIIRTGTMTTPVLRLPSQAAAATDRELSVLPGGNDHCQLASVRQLAGAIRSLVGSATPVRTYRVDGETRPLGGTSNDASNQVAARSDTFDGNCEAGPNTTAQDDSVDHGSKFTVLFVCTANICRSAYADVTSRARDIHGVEFGSAGTRGLVGRPIDPPMAEEIHRGGDPSQHTARQLTRDLLEKADLVLAMGPDHRRWILDAWPKHGRKVLLLGQAARIMSNLPADMELDGLVEYLWAHRSADPSDEVEDPYKRGPEAMATAARQIDAAMDVIAPALEHIAQR